MLDAAINLRPGQPEEHEHSRPRVEFPLSHLLINCLIGAVLWAGIIALIVGAASCVVGRAAA